MSVNLGFPLDSEILSCMFNVVTSSVFKELLLVLRSQTHAYSLKVVLAKKDTISWKSTPGVSFCHFPMSFCLIYLCSTSCVATHLQSRICPTINTVIDPCVCLWLSRVQLFATPRTVAHRAPLCDSSGKNTGVGCHFFSRGSSQPRD